MSEDDPYETVFYVIYDDGSLDVQTFSGNTIDPQPILGKPGRVVTKAEYDAAKAQQDALNAAYEEELRKADLARIKANYDALIAAGIPDAVARNLTGYTGP